MMQKPVRNRNLGETAGALGPVPPDLEELVREGGFADPPAARRRVFGLFRDSTEMLSLARLSGLLKDLLREAPDPDAGLLQLARFLEVRGSRLQLYRMFLDHPALLDRFVRAVSSSRYLADILVRSPTSLALLADSAILAHPRRKRDLALEARTVCAPLGDPEERLDALRRLHRREVLRIGVADLLGFQGLGDITRQISDLADVFVARSLSIVASPRERSGLIVLALGKWGGRELNYSSDIDVIFLARRPGDLSRATEVAQRLIRALSEPTYEGVVYRVDIRLRPYGAEGTLVATVPMFLDYLRTKARPAERQMMLKARPAAGDLAAGGRFLGRALPAVLLDAPSARRHVRQLKYRIEKQLHERGQADFHVKLAPGGIRDIEFLVQALQLEAGQTRPAVLGGNTLEAIQELEPAGLLASGDAEILRRHYSFLRTVEHRMQLMENQQVHRLPRRREDRIRLARTLGFGGADPDHQLIDAYDSVTRQVRSLFDRILGAAGSRESEEPQPLSATAQAVRRQMGPAAEGIDPDFFRKSADLLDQTSHPGEVRVLARRNNPRRWSIAVAARGVRGSLLLISGLLAARKADIQSGAFQELRLDLSEGQAPKARSRGAVRKTLSVFDVVLPGDPPAKFWDVFQAELASLAALSAGARDELVQQKVLDRVAESITTSRAPAAPLLPVRIEIRNGQDPGRTELRIQAPDTPGFLFEFAAALSALRVEVDLAVIRTLEDEVHDTLLITDALGRKIQGDRSLEELKVTAALVKQFTHLLPRSPNPSLALRQFTALLRQMLKRPEWVPELRNLESPTVLSSIAKLMGVSRFLWEDFLLLQHESLFPMVLSAPALGRPRSRTQLERDLKRAVSRASDPADALARLSEFRDREMFRADLRHLVRRSGFPELMGSLSDLAEVVIQKALELCDARMKERFGIPRRRDGHPCAWSVGALGKLGGRELGAVSDLDLLFTYDEEGLTDGSERIAASAYFSERVKALLQILKARREGSFEMDLRLRPYGDAGALASSFDGFAAYYSDGGPARQFERLALVKMRPVAGDLELGKRLLKARDKFVYSTRPLDIENILHLRRRQGTELVPPGAVDAKYSPGGLADVEYFVQAAEIQEGARNPEVRRPNTLEAVQRLVQAGRWRSEVGAGLSEAYLFLRRLIDSLRVVRGNAKDSRLPPRGSPEFSYLVRRLEYGTPEHLEAEIRQHMSFARNLWRGGQGP